MPLYQIGSKVTIKIVGYHPENPDRYGFPTILSSISQYDTNTGHLSGIADGVLLTALRTGAASAIATRHLAHQKSKVLGLIGCGAQAVTQLHAIARVFDIETILFYDKDPQTMASFPERVDALQLNAEFKPGSIDAVVTSSDILCTATSIATHEGPLFSDLNTKPHLHINAVGSDFPGKVEIPMDFIDQSFLCPDFIEQALKEGECQRLTPDRIDADLSMITRSPGKYDSFKHKRTVFDSTGWALEDHVIMNIFIEYARTLGIGTSLDLEFIPEDSKNPYHFIRETHLSAK
jgi:ornithine cyclodeaminase/alanine dehydrogenase-like protein (mu-crystallin family)